MIARSRRYAAARGFTLVELMVVVAVLILLAAILLPGLARAREYAYFTACKGHLHQMGLGLNTYASDNRGAYPVGESMSNNVSDPGCSAAAAIGMANDHHEGRWVNGGQYAWYSSYWNTGTDAETRLLEKVYIPFSNVVSDPQSYYATNWEGWMENDCYSGSSGYFAGIYGKPNQVPLYLPIEIFWDPIQGVRNWGGNWGAFGAEGPDECAVPPPGSGEVVYYKCYAGTERQRDHLSRRRGVLGYQLFIYSTGCTAQDPAHTTIEAGGTLESYHNTALDTYRTGLRYHTNHEEPRTEHKPSVWLAACQVPPKYRQGDRDDDPNNFVSHFGFSEDWYGWRFNVLHRDGSVTDQRYELPVYVYDTTSYHMCDWFWQDDGFTTPGKTANFLPYGWTWKDMTSKTSRSTYGLKRVPGITGAFDERP